MSLIEAFPRETRIEEGGSAKGVAPAIVRVNQDDSGMGRVKVSYPWHSEPKNSYWARIAMPMAGKDRGAYFLPEVGDEVLVAFERGDVRFPYIIGALWNGVDKAPATNADGNNDVRMIKTRKGHKLTFDDGQKGLVRLELNDGKKLEIDDEGMKLDDGAGNSLVIESRRGAVTIKAATSLSIQAPKIEIKASGMLSVDGGATLTLKGGTVMIN